MKDRHNMNNVMRAALALALLMGATVKSYAEPYKIPVFVELDTEPMLDGSMVRNNLYFNASFKINDRYTVTPEMSNSLYYREGSENKTKLVHNYVRFSVTDSRLAKLGDWNVDMMYRYYMPTTMAAQKDGSFGSFSVRPGIKRVFGIFTAYAKYIIGFGLQRNGYQLNVPDGQQKPTTIYNGAVQLLPSIAITDNLSFDSEIDFFQRYTGPAPAGQSVKRYHNDFTQIYALNYTIKSLSDLMVGIYIEQDTGDFTDSFKFFNTEETYGGFAIAKSF
ncbi:MAG: hypothetical protein JST16_17340 [Bdellovibrionales bacterium]|nr:hypothetical protein [Bdellovibrionales bacterium]